MTRLLGGLAAASGEKHLRLVTLFHFTWPGGGSLRATDAGVPVTDTRPNPDVVYQPTASLVDAGGVKESAEPRANSLTVQAEAVSSAFVGALLGGSAMGWQLDLHRAALSDPAQVRLGNQARLRGDPILIFRGRLSGWKLSGGGRAPAIRMDFASHWANFEAKNGRKTNHASQQLHFAGDKGFEFAAAAERELKWGQA